MGHVIRFSPYTLNALFHMPYIGPAYFHVVDYGLHLLFCVYLERPSFFFMKL